MIVNVLSQDSACGGDSWIVNEDLWQVQRICSSIKARSNMACAFIVFWRSGDLYMLGTMKCEDKNLRVTPFFWGNPIGPTGVGGSHIQPYPGRPSLRFVKMVS